MFRDADELLVGVTAPEAGRSPPSSVWTTSSAQSPTDGYVLTAALDEVADAFRAVAEDEA